jgi:hypothetical protein
MTVASSANPKVAAVRNATGIAVRKYDSNMEGADRL